jgi:NAD(P)-dependent dehydrogenase (short-subunit alcohol dehydrogenase family)
MLASTPTGRFGTPRDMAGGVVFLTSDASAFVTGRDC